jgi:phosphoenolpyruvate synthase/pyruvate phosphate dikinase
MKQSGMTFNCNDFQSADMQVLKHHVYEYKKGIRNMVLHTMKSSEKEKAIFFLKMREVVFWICEVGETKINVFFGNPECVEIVKSFQAESLNKLTPEQDFMLGIMLGYNRDQQYSRYLKQTKRVEKIITNEILSTC